MLFRLLCRTGMRMGCARRASFFSKSASFLTKFSSRELINVGIFEDDICLIRDVPVLDHRLQVFCSRFSSRGFFANDFAYAGLRALSETSSSRFTATGNKCNGKIVMVKNDWQCSGSGKDNNRSQTKAMQQKGSVRVFSQFSLLTFSRGRDER